MKLIWLSFIIEILILSFLQPFISDYQLIGVIVVGIHVILCSLFILSFESEYKYIFLIGFFLRVVLLFWDIYGRSTLVLPHSGADSEMYFKNSILISQNFSLLGNTRGNVYSDLMSFVVYIIGPQRITVQYINVLFGLNILFLLHRILRLLNINNRNIIIVLSLASIFPTSVIMSAIMLREIIPTFFVALSLYYFLKWHKFPELINILSSFITIGIASIFHSGVIAVVFGYLISFVFYDKRNNKFKITLKSISNFLIISIVLILAIYLFGDLLFGKFGSINEISDIYDTANVRMGGSRYLTSMEINNFLEMLIFGPIRAIYFLMAPMPWDWRGIFDMFSFMTDSIFYIYILYITYKYRKNFATYKPFVISIIVMILAASYVFGIGVFTAGTAIRHRQKITPIFLVLLALILEVKETLNIKHSEM